MISFSRRRRHNTAHSAKQNVIIACGRRYFLTLEGQPPSSKVALLKSRTRGLANYPSTRNHRCHVSSYNTLENRMKKTILVIAALACSALWAVAQTSTMPSSQSGAGQTSSSASSSSNPVTVDGCLAGAAGSFTLKDKATGTTYNLAGDTAKLASHVGQELQITGTAASASATSGGSSSATPSSSANPSSSASPAGAGSSAGGQTLNMTAAKMVSSTCSAQ